MSIVTPTSQFHLSTFTLASLCVLFATACAQGVVRRSGPLASDVAANQGAATGGQTSAASRTIFDTKVLPILQNKCSNCHMGPPSLGPSFLGAAPENFHDSLLAGIGYIGTGASDSLILTKGPHSGGAPSTSFSATETQDVTEWIESL